MPRYRDSAISIFINYTKSGRKLNIPISAEFIVDAVVDRVNAISDRVYKYSIFLAMLSIISRLEADPTSCLQEQPQTEKPGRIPIRPGPPLVFWVPQIHTRKFRFHMDHYVERLTATIE